MTNKRGKTKKYMQVQAKPSNRNYERNISKTINNVYEEGKNSNMKIKKS